MDDEVISLLGRATRAVMRGLTHIFLWWVDSGFMTPGDLTRSEPRPGFPPDSKDSSAIAAASNGVSAWRWKAIRGVPTVDVYVDPTCESGIESAGTLKISPGSLLLSCIVPSEFIVIEGSLVVTPETGAEISARPGNSFSIEAGSEIVWDIQSSTVLTFVLAET